MNEMAIDFSMEMGYNRQKKSPGTFGNPSRTVLQRRMGQHAALEKPYPPSKLQRRRNHIRRVSYSVRQITSVGEVTALGKPHLLGKS